MAPLGSKWSPYSDLDPSGPRSSWCSVMNTSSANIPAGTSERALAVSKSTATVAGPFRDYSIGFTPQPHAEEEQIPRTYDASTQIAHHGGQHSSQFQSQHPHPHSQPLQRSLQPPTGPHHPLVTSPTVDVLQNLHQQPSYLLSHQVPHQSHSQTPSFSRPHDHLGFSSVSSAKRRLSERDLDAEHGSLESGTHIEEEGKMRKTAEDSATALRRATLATPQTTQPTTASALSYYSPSGPLPPPSQHHHHHSLPAQTPSSSKMHVSPSGNNPTGSPPAYLAAPSVVGDAGMPSPAPRPRGPKVKFTREDDQLLIDLKENKALTWKQIADFFPGRTSGTLQVRYCTKLKAKTAVWTDDMVQKLRDAMDEYEVDRWRLIAAKVGNGFSATACKEKAEEIS
ncbi:hypothetical protein L228DRAFT_266790 [Xylona heveae TC161]|uniref:Myb-like domain-containing protein n=1 Tax=Xylona heveae (strain CBS 132557 / TC161) TaxID=1328760 RepID=A0A165I6H9_XYLHT|nr:hypothetical protein L228DRAFT_266790 [Xylona heveae TC161]KZF24455.1 hypothetical protein L228DRAFT_266790 [Xylona heveae TC161]